MVRNVANFIWFNFHSIHVFCTLSFLFVRPSFTLLWARLAVHSFAVHLAFGSLKSKPQRQRLQWMCVRLRTHSQWPMPTAWTFRCSGGELLFSLWTICLFAVFGCVVFERSFASHSFACSFLCRSFTCFIQGTSVCLVFKLLFKVIPQYCTAHLLLRTISHAISARALENGGFFFTARPRHRSKS